MNRPISPTLFLEASASPVRHVARMRIHWLDYAFFTLALIVICGGALFVLELGSAHSSGNESMLTQFMSESSVWMAALAQKLSYYGMLFLASVLNSAFMVVFVQFLRTLDRQFSRSMQRRWPSNSRTTQSRRASTPVIPVKQQRPATVTPIHRSFLLCPITR